MAGRDECAQQRSAAQAGQGLHGLPSRRLGARRTRWELSLIHIYVTANTLDELAAGMDVPAETLKATFARYDELVAAGEDTDFEKKAWLNSLEPPYHALRLNVCRYKTSGGFMVGPNNQVLDKEDKEIPGLYAAGAVTTLSYASVSTCMATGQFLGIR